MNMLPFLAFLVALLSFSEIGNRQATSLVARLEARYRAARTLQATFLERYTEGGRVVRSEAGTAYFRRPGKMRWEYQAPENNLFLVDGKTAWFYVPADHTVTRVPAKKSGDLRTPIALLAGEMKVSRVCARVEIATEVQPQNADDAVIHCLLRGDTSATTHRDPTSASSEEPDSSDAAFFEVVRDTGELVRILVHESAGVDVEFRFSRWQLDPALDDSLFRFEVPEGVAIVNGELTRNNE